MVGADFAVRRRKSARKRPTKRKMGKEEARLVAKTVKAEMKKIRSGKVKTIPLKKVLKELDNQ